MGVSKFMFDNADRQHACCWSALTTAVITVPTAVLLGRTIARRSVWERQARERERAAEAVAARTGRLDQPRPAHPAGRHPRDGRGTRRRPGRPRRGGQLRGPDQQRVHPPVRHGRRPLRTVQDHGGRAAPDAVRRAAARRGERLGGRAQLPVATRKRVRVYADVRAWPVVLGSDPELARIVRNLLSNAIRHTPPDGSVLVGVGRRRRGRRCCTWTTRAAASRRTN